jgi:hypothetical protein
MTAAQEAKSSRTKKKTDDSKPQEFKAAAEAAVTMMGLTGWCPFSFKDKKFG